MTYTYDDVERQVRAFLLRRVFHGLPGTGAEQENLLGTGVLDSLGVLEIVDFLETTFDIVVDEDDFDLDNFQSVSRIASFAHERCLASS